MKRLTMRTLVMAIVLLTSVIRTDARKFTENEYRQYEAGLLDIIRRANVPSIQLVYVTADDSLSFIVVNDDFYADPRCKPETVPLSDKTIYQACSISKLPLSYIAVKMIEEGLLGLDKPLYESYPGLLEMFVTQEDRQRARLLTPRICMAHRTGLDNKTYSNMSFQFTPDEKFQYSGPGIYVLQRTIEHITGLTLNELGHKYIFDPFGMAHTNYIWVPEYDTIHANGYNSRKWEDIDMEKVRKRSSKSNAAYSMRTTAAECTGFVRAVMHHRGMGEDAFKMMLSTYGEYVPAEHRENERHSLHRCLGWIKEDHPQLGPVYLHGGNNGRYKGQVLFIPSLDASLVYFTNAQHPYDLNTPICDLFFGDKAPFSFPRLGKEELKPSVPASDRTE